VVQLFEGSAIKFTVHLLIDTIQAGEQIVNLAEQSNADMVVLGLRRRSMVGKVIFGSNAQYIIINAPCPVLTVKRE
jgi:nucleotide-binding universal stress UspA family protein